MNYRLKILSDILKWEEDQPRIEFEWLRLMASVKYDDYRDYQPGMRFFENLASWLQQFDSLDERRQAYLLLRNRLIYVSPPEMHRLVELFYHCEIERRIIKMVSQRCNVPKYLVRTDPKAKEEFKNLLRRTLILGLSDGARTDILRQSTVGILSNEQFVIQSQVDTAKWKSLLKDLRKAQGADALFELVILVDDFMGTGSSFLRFDKDDQKWKGKLPKFLESLSSAVKDSEIVTENWELCVHHYLGTQHASQAVDAIEKAARDSGEIARPIASHYSFGAIVEDKWKITSTAPGDAALYKLTQDYYNENVETDHTKVGGVKHLGLGYGGCALPLVLHHNTPNNSLALLWAEYSKGPCKNGVDQKEVRPLFRRRQRHT